MYSQIFSIIAPVFICALIGFVWSRSGGRMDTDMVSKMVTNIGAPCLVVSTLSKVELELEVLFEVGLMCAIVLGVMSALSFGFIRLMGKDPRIYFSSMVFANVGNMGLPLCLFAFGEHGLALAIGYFMINSILHFSVGAVAVSGENIFKALVSNPIILSVVIAVTMLVLDWSLPIWAVNTVDLLAGFTIPLMLITLGVSLANMQVTEFGSAALFSLFRMAAGFVVALIVTWLFGATGEIRGVVILQASMPVAVFNYLFAKTWNRGENEVAGMIVISTAVYFMILPVLLAYVLQ